MDVIETDKFRSQTFKRFKIYLNRQYELKTKIKKLIIKREAKPLDKDYYIVTRLSVTIDGAWNDGRIYWTLWHTTRDYTLQFAITNSLVSAVTPSLAVAW
jgi:hypothetical protein